MDITEEYREFLTVDETAQILRISARTVYRFIQSKKVQAIRVGKQWRIDPDGLLKGFENPRAYE